MENKCSIQKYYINVVKVSEINITDDRPIFIYRFGIFINFNTF